MVRFVKLAFRYGDGSGEEISGEEILKRGAGLAKRSIDFGFKMHCIRLQKRGGVCSAVHALVMDLSKSTNRFIKFFQQTTSKTETNHVHLKPSLTPECTHCNDGSRVFFSMGLCPSSLDLELISYFCNQLESVSFFKWLSGGYVTLRDAHGPLIVTQPTTYS